MKVRIPFIINAAGKWCAYGYPEAEGHPDWDMMLEVASPDELGDDFQRGWIEVELPVPQELTASGSAHLSHVRGAV